MNKIEVDYQSLPGRVWFTSDTHYNHANIIKYCKRPFADVPDMNAQLAARHNAVVGPSDTLVHIGDFAMGHHRHWAALLGALNGKRKLLAMGNHDRSIAFMQKVGFTDVATTIVLKNTPYGDICCEHVPNRRHGHRFMLCGHVHEQWEILEPDLINVGVDVNGYEPVSLSRLVAKHGL